MDIAFTRVQVAIFVDGCFWHRCAEHGATPRSNRSYWEPKLARNVERDRQVDLSAAEAGWVSVHVWEHEDPSAAAETIAALLEERRRLIS